MNGFSEKNISSVVSNTSCVVSSTSSVVSNTSCVVSSIFALLRQSQGPIPCHYTYWIYKASTIF